MSWSPGPPYADPPGADDAPAPSPRRGLGPALVGVTAIVVVLLALGGAGWLVVDRIDRPAESAASPPPETATEPDTGTDPAPSSEWDPRVVELATFIEDVRSRPFLEPVTIEFLEDEAFKEAVVSSDGEITDEDRESLEISTAQLRALDMIGPDVDLLAEFDQAVGEGTLAFYDPETDAVTVRGTDLDVATRVTVVHELVHAWQDQHLDLSRIEEIEEDERAANLRTIAEGDAVWVQDQYVAELSAAEQQEYAARSQDLAASADAAMDDVPDIVQAVIGYHYFLGPPFVGVLDTEGGVAAIDDALADPPISDVALLAPERFFTGFEAVDVTVPQLAEGQERLDDGSFGAVSMLLTLGQRLDPRVALDVADGWAGDNTLTYREGERGCIAIAVTGVDEEATAAFASALGEWAAAGPAGSATAERTGDEVLLRSCEDPAAPAPEGEEATLALLYASVRLTLFEQILQQPRIDVDQAACFVGEVVDDIEPAELTGETELPESEISRRGTAAAIACLD